MTCTMLKSTFQKGEPSKLTYRDCKNFSFDRFKADLENALKSCPNSYDSFEQCFSSKLNEYAPKKTKWVRGNNKSHMNKFLRRAIMKRSKLKNNANETKHPVDIKMYKKQRNYVVGLNKLNLNILITWIAKKMLNLSGINVNPTSQISIAEETLT